jgi:hypothetical protein
MALGFMALTAAHPTAKHNSKNRADLTGTFGSTGLLEQWRE